MSKSYTNTFIVEIDHPGIRGQLAKYGKTGKPQSLNTIIIFKTDLTKIQVESINGVKAVEEETKDSPFDVQVQSRPLSWFLPSASNSMPDYQYNRTGEGVAIYVMDSGIRLDHDDFAGRDISTVFSYDGLDYGGDVDGPDHGSMAASCAAGNEHGIAKSATIYNVRYNWSSIEGIKALDSVLSHYMTHDMPAILSMSFGSYSNIYDSAFSQIAEAGIVMVAAAGNYDDPNAMFPARRRDVIAVAATDSKLEPSVWGGGQATNYGPEIDIWAGGTGGVAASIDSTSATQWAGGTSSACPLIAGATALRLEGKPKLTSYAQVLVAKQGLLDQAREGAVNYTDPKYDGTANRYIYTLVDQSEPIPGPTPEPTPEPTPTPEPDRDDDKDDKSSRNRLLIVGAAVIIIALLIFGV